MAPGTGQAPASARSLHLTLAGRRSLLLLAVAEPELRSALLTVLLRRQRRVSATYDALAGVRRLTNCQPQPSRHRWSPEVCQV